MDQVAGAAGISRKSLFLYFPSKGDLLWHRDGQYVEAMRSDLASASGGAGDPVAAMKQAVLAGLRKGTGFKYLFTRKGVISVGGFDTWAMLRLDENSPVADAQVFATPITYGPGMKPDQQAGALVGGYPMFPTSRGSIHATGSRLSDQPKIVASFYDTEHDRHLLDVLARKLRSFIESPELAKLGAKEYAPSAAVATEDDFANYTIQYGGIGYHPLGTCAMGPDDTEVVDDRCRVRGVEGLRVVDASIFLDQPSGNNSAPTSAAAWIASDLILADNA